jgi:hypothetical protein
MTQNDHTYIKILIHKMTHKANYSDLINEFIATGLIIAHLYSEKDLIMNL